MKALTLWQPYASLVMAGAKLCETRSWGWHTAKRGERLAIHSAARIPPVARGLLGAPHFKRVLDELADRTPRGSEVLPLGCILGTVELHGCHRTPSDPIADAAFVRDLLLALHPERATHFLAQELAFGDFGPERWAWALAYPRALPEPQRCRGHQRLWTAPARLEPALLGVA